MTLHRAYACMQHLLSATLGAAVDTRCKIVMYTIVRRYSSFLQDVGQRTQRILPQLWNDYEDVHSPSLTQHDATVINWSGSMTESLAACACCHAWSCLPAWRCRPDRWLLASACAPSYPATQLTLRCLSLHNTVGSGPRYQQALADISNSLNLHMQEQEYGPVDCTATTPAQETLLPEGAVRQKHANGENGLS